MADLPETSQWEAVYQIETQDPVIGGAAGISNQQGKNLANRTKWLRDVLGANVTTVNAANSPYALSQSNAGIVVMDASAGNVSAALPVSSNTPTLPFIFIRVDSTTNTATISAQAGDSVGGKSSIPLFVGAYRHVRADGVNAWPLVADQHGHMPLGTIIYRPTVADGYIKANGALVSRTDYADLFAYANGNGLVATEANWAADSWGLFGEGDGSSTFRLPDLRGEFLRGFDDGRGVDTGRVLGKQQNDSMQGHMHQLNQFNGTDLDSIPGRSENAGGSFGQGIVGGTNTANASGSLSVTNPRTDGTNGTPRTGPETRPRNIAYYAQIKY